MLAVSHAASDSDRGDHTACLFVMGVDVMDEKRKVSVAEVLLLPTPTDVQCETFIVHLADVHSWYKTLPLLGGAEFIVFLDPQAGQGYPLEHPQLPNNRTPEGYPKPNTVEVYRSAFGHLNYMWRASPFEPHGSDGRDFLRDPIIILDEFLAELGRFTLHPYIAGDFYWSVHEVAVQAISYGAYHPRAELVREAFAADAEMDRAWQELSNEQRELACALHRDPVARTRVSEPVARYEDRKDKYDNLMGELRAPEVATIRNHVLGLQKWHTRSCKGAVG